MKFRFSLFAAVIALLVSGCGHRQGTGVKEPESIEDISNARIVTILGSLQDLDLENNYPEFTNLKLNSTSELIAAVQSGNADYLLVDSISFAGFDLKSRGLKAYFTLPVGGDIAFGFRYDEKELADSYNAFLQKIRNDGTYAEIVGRWIKGDVASSNMPDIPRSGDGEPIVVGVAVSYPFEFIKNGDWAGFEVELMLRFAEFAGRPVRFENYDFNSITAALMTDKIDVICAQMTVSEERAKQVLFSDSHYYSGTVCIGRDPKRGGVPAISGEDLNSCRLGVLSGSSMDVYANETFSGAEIFRADGMENLVNALETGQVDAILSMDALSAEILAGHSDFIALDERLYRDSLSAVFSPGGAKLWKSFNDMLSSLKESGEYENILDRWRKDGTLAEMPVFGVPEGRSPLRIGIQTGTSAYCFERNGVYCGFSVELAHLFAKTQGRPAVFTDDTFSGLLSKLEEGSIDMICSSGTLTEARSKKLLFSDNMLDVNIIAITKKLQQSSGHTSFFSDIRESFRTNIILEDRWKMILSGLWETLVISLFSILLGTIVGAGLCGMRLSGVRTLDSVARFVIDIVRGIPMLVFLMIMFYVVFASSGMTGRWIAIIAFAINFGAYTSEMFRTGIEGVDRGQTEAGLAMGFTRAGTFINFILPQAVGKILPVYKGEAISLIKNTSIVGYIAIADLTRVSDIIRSRTFDAFFPLIIVSIIYFILAWLLGRLLDRFASKIQL